MTDDMTETARPDGLVLIDCDEPRDLARLTGLVAGAAPSKGGWLRHWDFCVTHVGSIHGICVEIGQCETRWHVRVARAPYRLIQLNQVVASPPLVNVLAAALRVLKTDHAYYDVEREVERVLIHGWARQVQWPMRPQEEDDIPF